MGNKTAKKAKADDLPEVEFFRDVEQRSDEWFALRRGIPTASKFSIIMSDGKSGEASVMRTKYMKLLAGEIISGQVAESFHNEFTDRGVRMEMAAREWYERVHLVDAEPIGFARRTVKREFPHNGHFVVGCSPDSQVGPRKGLEIKTVAPHLLVDVALRGAGGFPAEHRAQVQGTMWICDWDEIDLILFYEGWPRPPRFKVQRDDTYIAKLKNQIDGFDYELQRLVKDVRNR